MRAMRRLWLTAASAGRNQPCEECRGDGGERRRAAGLCHLDRAVNDRFPVSWDCPRGAGGNYFTEILTSAGGKASSARRNLFCSA